MTKITKAVIPAAGFGTRFLPWNKAVPKEMLPILDKPVIQYVVEEAVASGINEITVVSMPHKKAIADHFGPTLPELAKSLQEGGKQELLDKLEAIAQLAKFNFINQEGPYGNGTPVLNAEKFIGNEPFVVTWGDEFIWSDPPRIKQMIEVYEKYGGVVISGVRIEKKEDVSRYGIANIEPVEGNIFKIKSIVEKPKPEDAPSNLATHGAYLLPPEVFDALRNVGTGKGGELWLVDSINYLRDHGVPVYACEIKNGKYYDTGNKLEYLKTVVDFAVKDPNFGEEFKEYLNMLLSR